MELELKNVNLRPGDKLKVKGEILHDAERFQIDLGWDSDDLALHFNPRFHDDADGLVLVCNSKTAGCWGDEKREIHNPLQRGSDVKVRKSGSRTSGFRSQRCFYLFSMYSLTVLGGYIFECEIVIVSTQK
uniref:Galectin n=1 Tax=Fundulus heteroclitus TaxID=8078 RepID=A0A3Q2PYC2_FUNHE